MSAGGPMADACPPFEDAVVRFQDFLASVKWPTDVVWIRRRHFRRKLTRRAYARDEGAIARAVYSRGVRARLGVAIVGVWRDSRHTYAQIQRPLDDDSSERLLFSPGHLKISVPADEQEHVDSTWQWYLQDSEDLEQSALTSWVERCWIGFRWR